MQNVPPDLNMDVITCFDDDHELLRGRSDLIPLFYDRAWGSRPVARRKARGRI
ncbi:MAG: hypothetical protein AMXMBFR59_31320 [Rhodanobacteraceae bacterium]